MRVGRISIVVLSGVSIACAAIACVGSDPTPAAVTEGDAGTDTGATPPPPTPPPTPPPSEGGPDAADAGTICATQAPQLFAPVPGTGPFCAGAAGGHCAFGEHCCVDLSANTHVCAASCSQGVDFACFSKSECGDAGFCCGKGVVDRSSCTYATVRNLTATTCEAVCTTGFVECANNTECGGGVCTPARVIDPATNNTSTVQVAACQ